MHCRPTDEQQQRFIQCISGDWKSVLGPVRHTGAGLGLQQHIRKRNKDIHVGKK